MKCRGRSCWSWLLLGLITLPALQTSCVDIAQRAVINGFFNATTPVLNDCLAERLAELWDVAQQP